MSKIQVYCAASLDGFIAGPGDDLSWLGTPNPEQAGDPGTISFDEFMKHTGAMLMGRRTFEVVLGFGGMWPYGATPVFVATSHPLPDAPPSVSRCSGDIRELCEMARKQAGGKNVYLDGGNIISQALDAEIVDEMILTVAPVLLGRGIPLYNGHHLQRFHAEYLGRLDTMMQLRLTKRK